MCHFMQRRQFCVKCQILFSWKNNISLLSAEFVHNELSISTGMVKIYDTQKCSLSSGRTYWLLSVKGVGRGWVGGLTLSPFRKEVYSKRKEFAPHGERLRTFFLDNQTWHIYSNCFNRRQFE